MMPLSHFLPFLLRSNHFLEISMWYSLNVFVFLKNYVNIISNIFHG